jgi:hypothetical protein
MFLVKETQKKGAVVDIADPGGEHIPWRLITSLMVAVEVTRRGLEDMEQHKPRMGAAFKYTVSMCNSGDVRRPRCSSSKGSASVESFVWVRASVVVFAGPTR